MSTYKWIIGMLINILYDSLILILGVFSKEIRRMYVQQFYPELYKSFKEGKNEY